MWGGGVGYLRGPFILVYAFESALSCCSTRNFQIPVICGVAPRQLEVAMVWGGSVISILIGIRMVRGCVYWVSCL